MVSKFDYRYEEGRGQRLAPERFVDRQEVLEWFDARLTRPLFEHTCPLVAHWRGSSRWFVIVKLATDWCIHGLTLGDDEYAALHFDPFMAAREHLPEVRPLLDPVLEQARPARLDHMASKLLRPDPIDRHLPLAYRLWLGGSDQERREQPYWSVLPRNHSKASSSLTRLTHDGEKIPLDRIERMLQSLSVDTGPSDSALESLRAELVRLTSRLEAVERQAETTVQLGRVNAAALGRVTTRLEISETARLRQMEEHAAELVRARDDFRAARASASPTLDLERTGANFERRLDELRSRLDDVGHTTKDHTSAVLGELDSLKQRMTSTAEVVAELQTLPNVVEDLSRQVKAHAVATSRADSAPASIRSPGKVPMLSVVALAACTALTAWNVHLHLITQELRRKTLELTALASLPGSVQGVTERLDRVEREHARFLTAEAARQFVRAPEGGQTDLVTILEPYALHTSLETLVRRDDLASYVRLRQPSPGATPYLEDSLAAYVRVRQPALGATQILEDHLAPYIRVRQPASGAPQILDDHLGTFTTTLRESLDTRYVRVEGLEQTVLGVVQRQPYLTADSLGQVSLQALGIQTWPRREGPTNLSEAMQELSTLASGNLSSFGVREAYRARWQTLDAVLAEVDSITQGNLRSIGLSGRYVYFQGRTRVLPTTLSQLLDVEHQQEPPTEQQRQAGRLYLSRN